MDTMNDEIIIVFPTKKQIDYLKQQKMENLSVVLQSDELEDVTLLKYVNCIVKDKDGGNLDILRKKRANVLCCHEEALYWVSINGSRRWNYQFDRMYFDLLTKDRFKDYLSYNGINNAKYKPEFCDSMKFPIIAKPVIGFGGIGVKSLENIKEVKEYLEEYNSMIKNSVVKKYQDMYFPNKDNKCIFEEKIEGDFYRTPFIVNRQNTKWIFPIKGNEASLKSISDYHWVGFEYLSYEMNITMKVEPLFDELIRVFQLLPGVYTAEFMVSKEGDIFLLEFSPRQTSSRISKIIELAMGIDLEIAAIDLFLGRDIEERKISRQICLKIGNDESLCNKSEWNHIYSNGKEKNIYGNRVFCHYYEKVE